MHIKGGGKPYNPSAENLNRFYGPEDEETKVSNNAKKASDKDMDGSDYEMDEFDIEDLVKEDFDTKIKVPEPKIEKYDYQMEKYMNPIYGLVYCEIGYIPNIFFLKQNHFKIDNIPQTHIDIILNTCKQDGETITIRPTNELMRDTITVTDIGHYIAIKYVNMIAASDGAKFVTLNAKKTGYVPGSLYINNPKYNRNKEIQKQWSDVITSVSKFNKYIPLNDDDVFAFHMILFCLWWKANNNNGFDEYYKGIQEVFDIVNHCFPPNTKSPGTPKKPLILKEKKAQVVSNKTPKPRKINRFSDSSSDYFSDSSSYSSSDSSESDTPPSFEQIVIKLTYLAFPLYDQEQSLHFCKETKSPTYPDCGETTVRNIINILCFNGTNFDLSLLKEKEGETAVLKEGVSELVKYYTDFNTFEMQSKINPGSYTYIKNLNARNAWSKLIIDNAQNNMRFSNQCETADTPYGYDIDSGNSKDGKTQNILQMLNNLLPGVKTWDDLRNINITNVDASSLDKNGFGKVYIFRSHIKFTVHLQDGHFYVSISKKSNNQKDYSHIKNPHQKYFLNILYKNITEVHREYIRNTRNYADDQIRIDNYTKEFFKFNLDYNFSSEELAENINQGASYEYELVLKELLFQLSFTNRYDSDTRRRINIYIENDNPYSLNAFFDKFVDVCHDSTKVNEYSFVITDSFEFVRKLPLLKVLNFVYKENSSVKTIDLSPLDQIEHIGDHFLSGYSELTSINLSPLENVKTIGNYFLSGCKKLDKIDLKPLSNITSFGSSFMNKSGLYTIDLSPLINITSISNNFLTNCMSLSVIIFPETFKNITRIGAFFLANSISLRTIDLSYFSNVTTINDYFLDRSTIEKIDLSPLINLTTTENGFMSECKRLKSITFPENIINIRSNFLKETYNLKEIDLSPLINLTTIEDSFMEDCENLNSITFPENVTKIGNNFLNNTHKLKTIDLSCFAKVKTIGVYFLYNSGIESIDLSPLKKLTSINNSFMEDCGDLTSINFPEHVTKIGNDFLIDSSNLKTIDLSCFSNVTTIGDNFLRNSGIESIDLSPLKNLTTVNRGFMEKCKKLKSVFVPPELDRGVIKYVFTEEQKRQGDEWKKQAEIEANEKKKQSDERKKQSDERKKQAEIEANEKKKQSDERKRQAEIEANERKKQSDERKRQSDEKKKQSGDKQSGDKQSGDKQSGNKQSGNKQSGDKQKSNENKGSQTKKSREKKEANNCLVDPTESGCAIMGGKRPKRYTKKIKRDLKRKTRKYK